MIVWSKLTKNENNNKKILINSDTLFLKNPEVEVNRNQWGPQLNLFQVS